MVRRRPGAAFAVPAVIREAYGLSRRSSAKAEVRAACCRFRARQGRPEPQPAASHPDRFIHRGEDHEDRKGAGEDFLTTNLILANER